MSPRRPFLSLLIACAAAPLVAGADTPGKGEDLTLEGGAFERPQGTSVIVAVPDEQGVPPVLSSSGLRLEASRILYDRSTRSVTADSGVKLNFQRVRLISDKIDYRGDIRRLETGRVRLGFPPVMAAAESVTMSTRGAASGKVDTASAAISGVTLYFNEPDSGVISISSDKITYDGKTNILRAEAVTFRVGPVPVLYLPSYEQEGLDVPPVDPEWELGANARVGGYLRTTTHLTVNKRWEPGLLFDAYGRAGILVGPALRYDTSRAHSGDPALFNKMKGDLRLGYIRDHAELNTDQFGQAIDPDRHFVEWEHKQTVGDELEITSALHWWSDPFATRDFRPKLFEGNQSPDNFVEVVYPDRAFYGSFFVRHDPNGFEDINQRLPELRFDLNPREISDWRLYQRGHASFAYLRETTSSELTALPGTLDDTLATPRFDAYYGLTRPVTPYSAFGITPVLGVRSTTWFDAQNGDATYSRLAGQIGADAHLLSTGKWDTENDIWEVKGLRHRLRPVAQYRYLPGATDGYGRIPRIDRYAFLSAPPPIDLEQRRDTDEIHETQILRLGLENILQTRHAEYGSRDLLAYNVYQDFRDTDRPGDRVLSDTYSQFVLTPAEWVDFTLYNRIDPYSGDVHETTTATSFHDGDRWRLTVGSQRVTDVLTLDQWFVGWEYKIDSRHTLLAHWRYDVDSDTLTEQQYGVRRQLGHSWSVEAFVGYRRGARENSGTNVGVRMRLVTF